MKIIAIINEKGGTGKSTIATNLATALHRQGQRVVLIDADQQGTARDWRAASPEDADLPPVVAIDRHQMLASSLAGVLADIAIIDAPAKAESMAAAIIRAAHVALVVIQPSAADIWASAAAVKLIQAKRAIGGEIQAAFVINRASGNTTISKTIIDGAWNDYEGIEQLTATIGNRVVFANAMAAGLSVLDMTDTIAKTEIFNIIKEMETALWLNP
ncbi:ParA family partition ATPase [Propionivibrio sp.]|uniref:ParA family partition ATPase n=1 Tax=Propionivibrio sp. TaxID=2212460 RepID=UPI003BEF6EBF